MHLLRTRADIRRAVVDLVQAELDHVAARRRRDFMAALELDARVMTLKAQIRFSRMFLAETAPEHLIA